jgi:single-stranded-DNA-specific exonuclease
MLSILGKIWTKKEEDYSEIATVMNGYGVSQLVASLAINRVALAEMADFLEPRISKQMLNPFSLLDMEKAVVRFIKAIEKSECICLFADYDVDGATSAALLIHLLKHLNVEHFVYIPDRAKEGYGLSINAVEQILKRASCLITLDCGSSSYEEIAFAKSKGLDVIVIDHHMSDRLVTDAVAVVNPNRIDDTSQLQYLAAVGVTYLFLVAVVSHLKKKSSYSSLLESFHLLSLLDLVALGTVCDVVPIVRLNRAFVSQGLKVIRMRTNLGLRTLIDCVNLHEYIRSYHLGFVIGPRINAGGRVGKSDLGVRLLTATCNSTAKQIATVLDEHNTQRKTIEMQAIEQAQSIVEQEQEKGLIIVAKDSWHVGVIGIMASRLVEIYNVPVAVISWDGEIGKASCRSVSGFDFGATILSAKSMGLLLSGGGHKMAAGFSVNRSKFEELKVFLQKKFHNLGLTKTPVRHFDATLTLESLNLSLLDELHVLEPFGCGNPMPCFYLHNVHIVYSKIVRKDHVYCVLGVHSNSKIRITAIAFGAMCNKMGSVLLAKTEESISVIVTVQKHSWSGNESVRCIIKDVIEA